MVRARAAYIEFDDELLDGIKLNAKSKKLATEGIELDSQIKALKKRQDAIKKQLKEDLGEDLKYTLVIPGVGTVPVVPKEEVIIADANRLKEILDAEFDHYVKTSVAFKSLLPLVELVNDSDRPTHSLVVEATAIKKSCALSFKAEKK